MIFPNDMKNIEKAWTKSKYQYTRQNWWQSKVIYLHLAKKISSAYNYSDFPINERFAVSTIRNTGRIFQSALSIGCGNASKEMLLLKANLVNHFDVFELSKKRIEEGQQLAQKNGLEHNITFHYGDFFTSTHNKANMYDFIYWDNSLHHMLDTNFAVRTSYEILKNDGYFFCFDFVGKNRFQWSETELLLVNMFRTLLPIEFRKIPNVKDKFFPTNIRKKTIEEMIKMDISEAADSENILSAIKLFFPQANIVMLGGLLYHLGLNGILTNIPENSMMLKDILRLDTQISQNLKIDHYAFTLVKKQINDNVKDDISRIACDIPTSKFNKKNISCGISIKNIILQPLIKKKAFTLVNTNQLGRAEAIAQNVIINNPTMAWAYYILGKVQWQRGEHELAFTNLDKAIALEPKTKYFQTFKSNCKRKLQK